MANESTLHREEEVILFRRNTIQLCKCTCIINMKYEFCVRMIESGNASGECRCRAENEAQDDAELRSPIKENEISKL